MPLMASAGGDADGGSASTYERIARRVLYLGRGVIQARYSRMWGHSTRAWIRPAAFNSIAGHTQNEQTPCKRCQLKAMFPTRVKVVFFNDVYCESLPECMDEKWEPCTRCQEKGNSERR